MRFTSRVIQPVIPGDKVNAMAQREKCHFCEKDAQVELSHIIPNLFTSGQKRQRLVIYGIQRILMSAYRTVKSSIISAQIVNNYSVGGKKRFPRPYSSHYIVPEANPFLLNIKTGA